MTSSSTRLAPDSPAPLEDPTGRIVAAALAEFGEKGYAATRLADVAHRAHLSLPVLLELFPSKEEVFREVVRSTLVCALGSLHDGTHAPEGATAAEAVRALAHQYWATMEQPELTAMLRLTISELPRFPELAVFHASETLEPFLRALEEIIRGGIARGELRATDVRASARTVVATLAAHALWFAHPDVYAGLIGGDRDRAAAATIESIIRTLAPTKDEG